MQVFITISTFNDVLASNKFEKVHRMQSDEPHPYLLRVHMLIITLTFDLSVQIGLIPLLQGTLAD